MEKFCSKTARVFRYIRSNKYVEEGALQGAVMIPSKETKEITYKVSRENFPPADRLYSAAGESLHPPARAAEDNLEHGTQQVAVPLLCGALPGHQISPAELLQGLLKPRQPSSA